MSSVAQRFLTADEFARLPNSEHMELIQGVIVESMPPSREHGRLALAIGKLLGFWVDQGAGGEAGVEAGFYLARNPDIVRVPDVYYVSADRMVSDDESLAFWTVAPDLAIEVISPSETSDEIREKIRDYLAAGTTMVWTVHPRTQEIVVHTPDGIARTYSVHGVIEYPDVLPGFSLKIANLFRTVSKRTK